MYISQQSYSLVLVSSYVNLDLTFYNLYFMEVLFSYLSNVSLLYIDLQIWIFLFLAFQKILHLYCLLLIFLEFDLLFILRFSHSLIVEIYLLF